MKKVNGLMFLTVFLYCMPLKAQLFYSQQYNVGVPVNDTLFSNTITGGGSGCSGTSGLAKLDTNLFIGFFPYVTGVKLALIITSGSSIFYHVGDTLVFDQTHCSYDLSLLGGSGSIGYNLVAFGTPTQTGEAYHCDFQWTTPTCVCCQDFFFSPAANATPRCTVNPLDITENINDDLHLKLYPNPSNKHALFTVEHNYFKEHRDMQIIILDLYGKEFLKKNITEEITKIGLDGIVDGAYFFTVIEKNNLLKTGKIIIANR